MTRAWEHVTPVEIVRPKMDRWRAIDTLARPFYQAWIAMLCLGVLFPHAGISYWKTLVGLTLVTAALQTQGYDLWSRARKETK